MMTTPNDFAAKLAFEHKNSLRRQPRARRTFALEVLALAFLWAVAILFVLGWLAVGK